MKIENILKQIGQQISNCNELSEENINKITLTIKEWTDSEYFEKDVDFTAHEEICDLLRKEELFITLKDNSRWLITDSFNNLKCVNHSLFSRDNYLIFKDCDSDIFICNECGSFVKSKTELFKNNEFNSDEYLFPVDWTDLQVIEWIKRREENQVEYEKQREIRDRYRRRAVNNEDILNGLCPDTKCTYWKHDCEIGFENCIELE